MQFNFDLPNNIITIIFSVLSWGFISFLVIRQFLKQEVKPVLWRAILVALIGLGAFSLNITLFHTSVKLPILPLGVWFVYFLLKKTTFQLYRRFAWIGFWANFVFLIATLLSALTHSWVYPKGQVSTYVANVNDAAIIRIVPSTSEAYFHKEQFMKQLKELKPTPIESDNWYRAIVLESESPSNYRKEKFPYQLVGAMPKWGSGIATEIYIEEDSKGILITTANQQYYYRSTEPLIERGADSDE
ncbi:membrane protein CcdC involved in cytochrome C biogenesis [Paenibacillus castaneae]|uniref:hypothetical protein n=1 Tax=Paenibacillus castaneae TaxID=474957 RepID=UPI000C99D508|nr:hypothetical protein [Paenibacillus castaneae]NIK79119.1 membrane protein CcdC involved in cytochrome C biogenesis [Paenibacillus castaneae]